MPSSIATADGSNTTNLIRTASNLRAAGAVTAGRLISNMADPAVNT